MAAALAILAVVGLTGRAPWGRSWLRDVTLCVGGILVAGLAGLLWYANASRETRQAREAEEREQAWAEAADAAREQQAAEQAALLAEEPAAIASAEAELERARLQLAERSPHEARETVEAAVRALERFSELDSTSDSMKHVRNQSEQLLADIEAHLSFGRVVEAGEQALATDGNALRRHELLVGALEAIRRLSPEVTGEHEQELRELSVRLERAELAIREDADAIRAEEARLAAYRVLCGERIRNTDFRTFTALAIEQNSHDPDSISVEECTTPTLDPQHCWVAVCRVRGMNQRGARVLQLFEVGMSRAQGVTRLQLL